MFLEKIQEGVEGKNIGLKTFLPKFSKALSNIQDREYHVLGAQKKTGKTSFVQQFYILGTYLLNPNVDVQYLFYNYEMPIYKLMAKAVSFIAWYMYKKELSDSIIFSKGENKPDKEQLELINLIYKNHIIPLFGEYDNYGRLVKQGKITFVPNKINPTGMKALTHNWFKDKGDYVEQVVHYEQSGVQKTRYEKTAFKKYDDTHQIILVDHCGLMPLERGFNRKQNIDKWSEYVLEDRNSLGGTWVDIFQLNRGMSSIDRMKFSGDMLVPTAEDFKETGNPIENCDTAIALFNPQSHKHLHKHLDYDLDRLNFNYRSAHILENRNGEGFLDVGLYFKGAAGFFEELPKSSKMTDALYRQYSG